MNLKNFVAKSVLISAIFLILNTNQWNEAVIFKFTNAICESLNKSWAEFHTCRLKAVARNKIVFNLNGTIHIPANNIVIRCEILKKANGYKPWLFNTSFDACRFMRRPYNSVVILLFNQLTEFSNINHTCPYMGPQIVKNLYLRPELLNNLPVPTGEYLLRMTWFFNRQHLLNTHFYVEYIEDL